MPLTGEQYSSIMNILAERRRNALREHDRRQAAAEERFPAIRRYSEEMASLASEETEVRLGRRSGDSAALREKRRGLEERKRKLLIDSGLGADYLDIHYSCEKCRDTGYIGTAKCGCLKQLESEALNAKAGLPDKFKRENFAAFDLGVFDDSMPIPELKDSHVIATQREYMANVRRIAEEYTEGFESPGSHNILMTGPAGTGKTFISSCIAAELINRQHMVVYVHAGDYFERQSRDYFSRSREDAAEQTRGFMGDAELLIIDDLGTEFITEQSRAKLFSIVSDRLDAGLSTIISTNFTLNQISSVYSERLSSRFFGEYLVIPFYGADVRVTKAGGY